MHLLNTPVIDSTFSNISSNINGYRNDHKKHRRNRQYDALICGFYGKRNSGDDALLLATLHGLQHHKNYHYVQATTVQPLTYSGFPSLAKTLTDVPSYRGQQRFQQLNEARRAGQLVFGGGSVLHCPRDMLVKRMMNQLTRQRRAMAVGIGIEPFHSRQAEQHCKHLLSGFERINVRDQQSHDIAQTLLPNAPLRLTFDLAPSLLHYYPKLTEQSVRNGIGINLCPITAETQKQQQQRIRAIAKLLLYILDTSTQPVVLLDINGDPKAGDRPLHLALLKEVRQRIGHFDQQQQCKLLARIKHVAYQADPITVIKTIKGLSAIFSMRLHGAIFAYMTATPCVVLDYHPKCQQWAQQVGLAANYIASAQQLNGNQLTNLASDILATGYQQPKLAIEEAVARSLTNWL